jgi:hypothetical protein
MCILSFFPEICYFEFKIAIFIFRLPGDSRTRIGFMTFDSTVHFYNLQEGLSQPQMLIVSDIDGKHWGGLKSNSHSGMELQYIWSHAVSIISVL